MKHTLSYPIACLAALSMAFLFSSCDAQGQQDDFVNEAGLPASGITRILDNAYGGDVCSEDPDDWRISPVYSGVIRIERGAAPNPASSALVTIDFTVLQLSRIRGSLSLRAFGSGNTFITLDTVLDASSPGGYVFQFNSSVLQENGLHRLFIFDGVGELVSYGDIELSAEQPQSC